MSVTVTKPGSDVLKLVDRLDDAVAGTREEWTGRDAFDAGYRVFFLHPKTGQKGPEIQPDDMSWVIVINGIEDINVTVQLSQLAGIDRKWYTPRWGGVLVTYSRDGVETPVVAGPLADLGDITADRALPLEAHGLRWVYETLVAASPIPEGHNISKGHALWLLARQANIKPGGAIPIVDGSPDAGGRGYTLDIQPWDLQNNTIDKLMTEVTETEDGPDIMFRPEWVPGQEGRFIRWSVVHGTSRSPRITPTTTADFDTTAPESAVTAVTMTTDTTALVSRVWATGSGEGAGTLIERAEDNTLLEAGFLFAESVVTRPSETRDTTTPGVESRTYPVALSVPITARDAPQKATVRLPLALKLNVRRWRLHIQNDNPTITGGGARTDHVKFGDLYIGSNWNNGGMGNPEKVTDIIDISAGSSETVTGWVENSLESNVILSFDYETAGTPRGLYGGGWVRSGVRDAARQGYKGMVKTTNIPFRVWVEVEVEASTPAIAMLGSSSAAGFGANLPIFDSPLTWYARANGAIPVHYTIPGDRLIDWANPDAARWNLYPGTDRTDDVLMYLGSNDIYGGATLNTLRSRFNTVVDLASRRIGTHMHAVTIPPRTSATGATETVRRAFNQWLTASPPPPLIETTYNPGALVSTDDETIRPDYDAGDGTHLNAAGYKATAESLTGLLPVDENTPLGARLATQALKDIATGELAARRDATDQITLKVRADDPKNGLGLWHVADPAMIHIGPTPDATPDPTLQALAIPPGTYRTEIIKAEGNLAGDITIDFQTGVWS